MRLVITRMVCGAVVALSVAALAAQQAPASKTDPRIGLKSGLRDAGEAAKNLERIATLSKPEGFFDPKAPGGTVTPPERDPNEPPPDPNAPRGSAAR